MQSLDTRLESLDRMLSALRLPGGSIVEPLERCRADASALRFHLSDSGTRPLVLAVLGGTGTGKSTLVNRLLDADLTATSFRRTFTSGAIAIAHQPDSLPPNWLGLPHQVVAHEDLPARGQPNVLLVVPDPEELTKHVTLVDTPDIDGDQPLHRAQADRVFRWAQAILFLVSPEKYQMTELVSYYRMAKRYAVPALFAMNKCETPDMLQDYAQLLAKHLSAGSDQVPDRDLVYAIPRDDAGYEPPEDRGLAALRQAIMGLKLPELGDRLRGLSNRAMDLVTRLIDQVIAPLRQQRRQIDALIPTLRAIQSPPPDVDVNPITEQVARRLRERSILYLMGPERMLDRVRQVPTLVARLPRAAWDVVIRGHSPKLANPSGSQTESRQLPDFRAVLVDQFITVQSDVEGILRGDPLGRQLIETDPSSFMACRIDPAEAGKIADEEIAELRQWLENRWNATPRDTRALQRLLKHLPGGEKLTRWSEAAPYLVVVAAALHHFALSGVDLLIIGSFSMLTWLTEKLSNEVAARARLANRRIADRFTELAQQQIERTIAWLDAQSPSTQALDTLEQQVHAVAEAVES